MEAIISEYRHKIKQVCLKKASRKVAKIEKARPPAWDPPKLLMVVVSGLHVVVGNSSVVGVVVDGGVWLLDSIVWSQQSGIDRGKGGAKQS